MRKIRRNSRNRRWIERGPIGCQVSLHGGDFLCSTMDGRCLVAVHGSNIQSVHGFFGPILGCYDKEFHMRAALNPTLRWDQIHQQLWLQIMTASRPSTGDLSDSGHVVTCSATGAGPRKSAGSLFKVDLFAGSLYHRECIIGNLVSSGTNAHCAEECTHSLPAPSQRERVEPRNQVLRDLDKVKVKGPSP